MQEENFIGIKKRHMDKGETRFFAFFLEDGHTQR